jgi:hypothetical protein
MRLLEKDKICKWICESVKFHHRDKEWPVQTFLVEYCFGVWLVNNPQIKYKQLIKKPIPNTLVKKPFTLVKRALNAPETLAEIYQRHRTDINRHMGHGDKGTLHGYIDGYSNLFEKYRNLPITLLEIGVAAGHSVRMWREYFPKAKIIGIDIRQPILSMTGIQFFLCDQSNSEQLNAAFKNILPDIIIDDGSHVIDHQLFSIKHLFPKLKNKGLYVIEDMQDPENDIAVLSREFKKPDHIIDTREKTGRYDDMLLVWEK